MHHTRPGWRIESLCIEVSMAVLRWILAAGIIVILPGELNCQLTCIPENGCKFKLSNGETFDFCPSFEHGAATTLVLLSSELLMSFLR